MSIRFHQNNFVVSQLQPRDPKKSGSPLTMLIITLLLGNCFRKINKFFCLGDLLMKNTQQPPSIQFVSPRGKSPYNSSTEIIQIFRPPDNSWLPLYTPFAQSSPHTKNRFSSHPARNPASCPRCNPHYLNCLYTCWYLIMNLFSKWIAVLKNLTNIDLNWK